MIPKLLTPKTTMTFMLSGGGFSPCLQMIQEVIVCSIIAEGSTSATAAASCTMATDLGNSFLLSPVLPFWFNGHSARQWPIRPQRRHAVSAIRWDGVLERNPLCFPLPKPFFLPGLFLWETPNHETPSSQPISVGLLGNWQRKQRVLCHLELNLWLHFHKLYYQSSIIIVLS